MEPFVTHTTAGVNRFDTPGVRPIVFPSSVGDAPSMRIPIVLLQQTVTPTVIAVFRTVTPLDAIRQNGCAKPTLVPGNDALVDGYTVGCSLTVPFAIVPVLPVAKRISRTLVSVVPVACSVPFTTNVTSFTVAPSTTSVPLTVTALP